MRPGKRFTLKGVLKDPLETPEPHVPGGTSMLHTIGLITETCHPPQCGRPVALRPNRNQKVRAHLRTHCPRQSRRRTHRLKRSDENSPGCHPISRLSSMLSRADSQAGLHLLHILRQTHLNSSHTFGGAKTHSGRRHKRPVHNSGIQDQRFLFLVLLVNNEDSEKIFRSPLRTRPKKTNLQQTCKRAPLFLHDSS